MKTTTENRINETTRATLTYVSPAVAAEWLRSKPDYQRKLHPKHVEKLASAILAGEWRLNGATIVFNDKGELIDGQHRLAAIVEAGQGVSTLVVTGVPQELAVFHTLGDVRTRRLSDFLNGKRNVTSIASCIGYIAQWRAGHWPPHRTGNNRTMPELLEIAEQYEGQIDNLTTRLRLAGSLTGQSGFCLFLALMYTESVDTERTLQFFDRLGDGVGLSKDSPIYWLRNRFMAYATKVSDRREGQAIIIKALHMYLDGQTCSLIRYAPKEDFPVLRGTL